MKLEALTVIFLIIIIPISIVLSEYVDNRITTEKRELEYNTKLLNATYDAIKSYQMNTVNNYTGDDANSRINDLEGAANTFYTSLATNFNYTGYKSEVMQEYVPAIAFTLYDGYYIYSPFTNLLTEVDSYDTTFSKDREKGVGLKTYVYYSCRYTRGTLDDFIITYSLDNYITIQGMINGKYIVDYGYLYNIAKTSSEEGIYKNGESYFYDGIEFNKTDTEEMKEFIGEKEYSYVKINGVKYYLDENYEGYDDGRTNKWGIFFINKDGTKNYSTTNGYSDTNSDSDNQNFMKYYNAIKNNKSAYEYYKNAYEFSNAILTPSSVSLNYDYWDKSTIDNDSTKRVKNGYGLNNLRASDATLWNNSASNNIVNLQEYGDINIFDTSIPIQKEDSSFNKHRKSIIRYVVETNLIAAISNYSSNNVDEYIMPKISEEDWELIQNEPCAVSFMQGMNIGSKIFNGYKVVQNKLSKEHIDEDDIYLLTTDNTYVRVIDKSLINATNPIHVKDKGSLKFYAGIWKLNFEKKIDRSSGISEISYVPMSYDVGQAYMGSYTSIMGNSQINYSEIEKSDMYTYVHNNFNPYLKKIYYMALGRERHGAFHVNNISYETYGSNAAETYFLKDY